MFLFFWMFFNFHLAFGQAASNMTATLKPGSSVYAKPEFAADPSNTLSTFPWNYWRERCEQWVGRPSLTGKVLYENNKTIGLQLDGPENFCGDYFNDGAENKRIVHARKEDLESTEPRGEETTEAAISEAHCPHCHDPSVAALRAIKAKDEEPPKKACRKTDDETEEYMNCHATPHQANYDKHYKKLFDLAGRTFQATYMPGAKGGVRAIVLPEDFEPSGERRPFMVNARANVMKCIGLRESMWNPKKPSAGAGKNSRGGAMGIGQQVEGNVQHINCLLKGYCRDLDKKTQKKIFVQREPTKWAVDLWNEYFRRAKLEFPPAQNKDLYTNPVTGQRCTEAFQVKERDAPCPINSIAAMAIYQVEAELTIRRSSPMYKDSAFGDFNENERCDLEIVQGSTNNAGTGTVRLAVKDMNDSSMWRGRLRESTNSPDDHGVEVDQFSKYIRNCVEAGNMDSMHPIPDEKDEEDKNSKKIKRKKRKASDCSPFAKPKVKE